MFDGQSHNTVPAVPFPVLAMQGRPDPWVNLAIGGQSWTSLSTTQQMRAVPLWAHEQSTVILTGGTHDIGVEGDTAATAFADLLAYATAYRQLRASVIVCATVPPAALITGGEETQRLALNDLIRSSAEFDAVLDLAAAPELDDPTDTTYYMGDQVHFTAAGAQVAADLLSPILG